MNDQLFRELFNRMHKDLLFYSRSFVNSVEAAEDIVADSFIKFYKANYDINIDARAYLYTIVQNACLDYLKHSKRKKHHQAIIKKESHSFEDAIAETALVKSQLMQLIYNEAKNFPEGRKNVFKCIFVQDMTVRETAMALRIKEDTVRVQIHRITSGLRKLFTSN